MEYHQFNYRDFISISCHNSMTIWGCWDGQNVHNVAKNKDLVMNSASKEYVKGLFTPSFSVYAGIDARVDAWKEYIDFHCTTHTKRQRQHKCSSKFNRVVDRSKSVYADARRAHGSTPFSKKVNKTRLLGNQYLQSARTPFLSSPVLHR